MVLFIRSEARRRLSTRTKSCQVSIPYFVLLHGKYDAVVSQNYAIDFWRELQLAGLPSECVIMNQGDHFDTLFDLIRYCCYRSEKDKCQDMLNGIAFMRCPENFDFHPPVELPRLIRDFIAVIANQGKGPIFGLKSRPAKEINHVKEEFMDQTQSKRRNDVENDNTAFVKSQTKLISGHKTQSFYLNSSKSNESVKPIPQHEVSLTDSDTEWVSIHRNRFESAPSAIVSENTDLSQCITRKDSRQVMVGLRDL